MGLRSKLKNRIKRTLGVPAPSTEPAPVRAAPPASTAPLPSEPTEDGFHAVVASSNLVDGGHGTYAAGDLTVVVFREADALYAIDNTCTHEDGPIADAADGLNNGSSTRSQFAPKTGQRSPRQYRSFHAGAGRFQGGSKASCLENG